METCVMESPVVDPYQDHTIHDTIAEIRKLGVEAFCEKYAVMAKPHREFPNLVLFKYNQIAADMRLLPVRHCRGLILDTAQDFKVVCWTYRKFANEGEGYADPIDWSRARVYEKEDGSLMQLYWYDGRWRVASSGTADAGGDINGAGRFSDLFWKTWNDLGYKLPPGDVGVTFAFELCTKFNRILVAHDKPRIVLHGARDMETMKEVPPEQVCGDLFGWEIIKSYPLTSLKEILAAAEALKPDQSEGFVVCDPVHSADGCFQRRKNKSPAYVALSHMAEGMGPRRLVEIARLGESSEFLAYFPQWANDYHLVSARYHAMIAQMESAYATIEHIENQKAFALEACKYPWSGALFQKRKRGTDFKQFVKDCTITSVESWLGVKPGSATEP